VEAPESVRILRGELEDRTEVPAVHGRIPTACR
jgi:hypothetical protein